MPRLPALAVLAAVLLAMACAGSAAVDESLPTEAQPDADAANEAGADPADDAPIDADAVLPLDAVLLEAFGTDDLDRYRWDIERDAEQALIGCMADAGFDFFVDDPLPPGPTRAELESADYATEFGFGIVSGFRNWIETLDVEQQQRDRNNEYLRTLTGGEIQRYLLTLDGEPPEPGQLPDPDSCRASSSASSYAQWIRFLDLLPNYTGIGEERDTHPEWLAAGAEWRACMLERGLDYAEPDAVRSDVTRRMNDAVSEVYPDGNLPLLRDADGWTIDPVVEPLLDELQTFELTAAVANAECLAPLAGRFEAVEREVQQGFVDRNRDAIDELLHGA